MCKRVEECVGVYEGRWACGTVSWCVQGKCVCGRACGRIGRVCRRVSGMYGSIGW